MLNEPDLTVGDLETVLIKALCQEYPESSGYHISHPYVRSDLVGSFMVSSEKGIVYESADVHPVAMFIKKYLASAQLNGKPLNGYLSPEMLEIGYDKDRPTHRLTVTFYISPEYKEFILKHNKGLPGTYPIRGKSICDPQPPQELGDAFFSLLSEIHREFDSKEFSIAVAG